MTQFSSRLRLPRSQWAQIFGLAPRTLETRLTGTNRFSRVVDPSYSVAEICRAMNADSKILKAVIDGGDRLVDYQSVIDFIGVSATQFVKLSKTSLRPVCGYSIPTRRWSTNAVYAWRYPESAPRRTHRVSESDFCAGARA
jgi:hypothetical protein